ncbi:MAG: peptide ABC transporter substrate-binding protein [Puniceicoccales bacterium]
MRPVSACLLATLSLCSWAHADPQILRRGNGSELQSLDPHIVTGVPEARVLRALYSGLVALDSSTLETIPATALSWEVLDQGTRYRFHLDPDARWSNGDPVQAQDFQQSIQRILTPALGAGYASQLFVLENARDYFNGGIEDFTEVGVKVLDPLTLELSLEAPTPYFLSLLVNPPWFPVHRPSIEAEGSWTSRNSEWAKPGKLVSNGPYQLSEWRLNDYLRVTRNPHFPRPEDFPLDEIVFFPIPNIYTEERSFLDGLIDVTAIVSPQRIRFYLEGEDPGVLQIEPDLGVYYLLLNTTVPPLDDVRVRQALSLSLERSSISRDIRKRGEPPAAHFTPTGIAGYNPPAVLQENTETARQLLAEAGYDADHPLPPLPLLFNTSETHRPIAEAIQALWKNRLGVEIQLVNKEWKTYLNDRQRRDFTIARAGWLGDYLDPETFLGLWTSDSTNNFSGWSNPEYDSLLAQAAQLPSSPQRNDLLAAAEEILLNEVPIIPIFFYNRAYLLSPRVKNWPTNILGYTNYAGIEIQD